MSTGDTCSTPHQEKKKMELVDFSLISIADGSFLCHNCGNVIYDLRHTCDETLDRYAKHAENLLKNINEND